MAQGESRIRKSKARCALKDNGLSIKAIHGWLLQAASTIMLIERFYFFQTLFGELTVPRVLLFD